jgi:hypothetical protein
MAVTGPDVHGAWVLLKHLDHKPAWVFTDGINGVVRHPTACHQRDCREQPGGAEQVCSLHCHWLMPAKLRNFSLYWMLLKEKDVVVLVYPHCGLRKTSPISSHGWFAHDAEHLTRHAFMSHVWLEPRKAGRISGATLCHSATDTVFQDGSAVSRVSLRQLWHAVSVW